MKQFFILCVTAMMTFGAFAAKSDLYPMVEQEVVIFETRDTFNFGFDEHFLYNGDADAAQARLDELADILVNDRDKVIRVEGHTDEVGTTTYNYELSQRRIDYVMASLLQRNVCLCQIIGVKYEELEPVADGHSDQSWFSNRNVFLAIHDKR